MSLESENNNSRNINLSGSNTINRNSNHKEKMDFFKKMTLIMVIMSAIVVLLLFVSILTSVLKGAAKSNKVNIVKSGMINVSIKQMELEDFSQNIVLSADLKSLNGSINVFAPINGTLIRNSVRLGDKVKIGDELGIVDASDIGLSYKPSSVIAKADGVITHIGASSNQKVTVSSLLYTIEPEPDFVLSGNVSESDADSLTLGSIASFTTAGDRQTKHTARLTYISPSVNTTTRSVALELSVDKSQKNLQGLRNGAFVELTLSKAQRNNVFVVPKDAIRAYNDSDVVYIVDENNIAKRVEVKTGLSTQSQVVIESGISIGDKVIVQGAPQDGDKVQIL